MLGNWVADAVKVPPLWENDVRIIPPLGSVSDGVSPAKATPAINN